MDILGGHLDSVAAGPGINDDGSGTVAVLELAIQLAKYSLKGKNAVRFGAFPFRHSMGKKLINYL